MKNSFNALNSRENLRRFLYQPVDTVYVNIDINRAVDFGLTLSEI